MFCKVKSNRLVTYYARHGLSIDIEFENRIGVTSYLVQIDINVSISVQVHKFFKVPLAHFVMSAVEIDAIKVYRVSFKRAGKCISECFFGNLLQWNVV